MATMTNKKKQNPLTIVAVIAAVVLVAAVLILLYHNHQSNLRTEEVGTTNEHAHRRIEVDGKQYVYNSDLISLLVLGVDTTELDDRGQTDAIYLVVLDRGEEKIKIISISRDAMVPIRLFDANGKDLGWETQHLALAYSFGSTAERGCLLVEETVSRMFFNVPMVYYAAADISLLPRIQNLVGKLEVVVPNASLEYLDQGYDAGSTVVITDENVEQFVRSRDTEQDFSNDGRMERQKAYIEAYLAQLKERLASDFSGVVSDLSGILPRTSTNIDLTEITNFANMLLDYEFSDEDYYILEGESQSGMFHDEFIVDEAALQELALKIFYKEENAK